MKSLDIIIPTRNEERGIVATLKKIPLARLRQLDYEVRVIVVDSSTDRTPELARHCGVEVVNEPRRGYGRAYKTGFEHSHGEFIATLDADGTYPAHEIPELLDWLNAGYDFVTTWRNPAVMSGPHQMGNSLLSRCCRVLFGVPLQDCQSGMWVFRRSVLDDAILRSDSWGFSQELKIEACFYQRYSWAEVAIPYEERIGETKMRAREGVKLIAAMLAKRIRR